MPNQHSPVIEFHTESTLALLVPMAFSFQDTSFACRDQNISNAGTRHAMLPGFHDKVWYLGVYREDLVRSEIVETWFNKSFARLKYLVIYDEEPGWESWESSHRYRAQPFSWQDCVSADSYVVNVGGIRANTAPLKLRLPQKVDRSGQLHKMDSLDHSCPFTETWRRVLQALERRGILTIPAVLDTAGRSLSEVFG